MICQVKLIKKNKFAKTALDKNVKAVVTYICSLKEDIIIDLGK